MVPVITLRAAFALILIPLLSACACLPAGGSSQGLSALRIPPSQITAKDEVPRAPQL